MKFRKFIFFSLVVVITLSVFGLIATSKILASTSGSILVDIAPENPSPGENVSIALSSYADNLDSVLITWFVNGKNVLSGIGKKLFLLNAPNAGLETSVVARIALPGGNIEKKVIIRSSVMVLLWQANDSYTPPFYKGKALPSPGSQITVVAMPEIKSGSKIVSAKNMIYAWKQDYTNDQEASGYGKNSFTYTNDYLENSNNITVTASTIDQKYSSEANIDIGAIQPKILFYKNDPTLGTLWGKALQSGHKVEGEKVIQAAPYFISPKDIRIPILTWDWSINDTSISVSGTEKNLIPLKVQAGISGTSKIKLEINNIYKIFETTNKEISVEF